MSSSIIASLFHSKLTIHLLHKSFPSQTSCSFFIRSGQLLILGPSLRHHIHFYSQKWWQNCIIAAKQKKNLTNLTKLAYREGKSRDPLLGWFWRHFCLHCVPAQNNRSDLNYYRFPSGRNNVNNVKKLFKSYRATLLFAGVFSCTNTATNCQRLALLSDPPCMNDSVSWGTQNCCRARWWREKLLTAGVCGVVTGDPTGYRNTTSQYPPAGWRWMGRWCCVIELSRGKMTTCILDPSHSADSACNQPL